MRKKKEKRLAKLIVLRSEPKTREPSPGAVDLMKDILKSVESGEVRDVIVVGSHVRDGEDGVLIGFSLPARDRRVYTLLGALEEAKWKVLRKLEDR